VKCQLFLADGENFAALNVAAPASLRITLTSRRIAMQITSKGQVRDHARIRKARQQRGEDTRGRLVLEVLRGSADTRMSTDEILALTRSGPRRAKRQ
jgi:hypothetical protein